jgi:hypothetical protein
MTAEEYKEALASLGMSQSAAADFLGISIRTAHAYAHGRPIPTAVARLLRILLHTQGVN